MNANTRSEKQQARFLAKQMAKQVMQTSGDAAGQMMRVDTSANGGFGFGRSRHRVAMDKRAARKTRNRAR